MPAPSHGQGHFPLDHSKPHPACPRTSPGLRIDTWEDLSPAPDLIRAISHLPQREDPWSKEECPCSAGRAATWSQWTTQRWCKCGTFPRWQVPLAQEAVFIPKAPCLQLWVPTGDWRACRSAHAPLQGGCDRLLLGGKALYNLLKQEGCSPNVFWLTEMNPKTSFNQLIKRKKKGKKKS